ncbi:hypothetical protein TNIN_269571 [Trichonephila inaurata madagascariensis]|uniref:Uncharacterized protein n=1 Tax=Trichonephila inaurata madagascariensis TaxID=2747483 RepID=A0A8X7CKM0_9ARAC|nr:hypothetical protein TNIN_269571 [Trichonephila inaurata madagascariensis]
MVTKERPYHNCGLQKTEGECVKPQPSIVNSGDRLNSSEVEMKLEFHRGAIVNMYRDYKSPDKYSNLRHQCYCIRSLDGHDHR